MTKPEPPHGPLPGETTAAYFARAAAEGEARRRGRPLPPVHRQPEPQPRQPDRGNIGEYARAARARRPGPLLPAGPAFPARMREPGEDDE